MEASAYQLQLEDGSSVLRLGARLHVGIPVAHEGIVVVPHLEGSMDQTLPPWTKSRISPTPDLQTSGREVIPRNRVLCAQGSCRRPPVWQGSRRSAGISVTGEGSGAGAGEVTEMAAGKAGVGRAAKSTTQRGEKGKSRSARRASHS